MQISEQPRNKHQLRREASYRALLDSAMESFADRGYAATTLEDIVGPTPYTTGAFYYHFANKAECFWHVIEHRERLREQWQGFPADFDPANATLAEMIDRALGDLAADMRGRTAWVLVMVDFFQQHRNDPEMRPRFAAIYERWIAELARFVVILQAGGWVDPDRDPNVLATKALAYHEGLAAHANLYGIDPDTFEATVKEGLHQLFGPQHVH
jgi:AcrR family transcriptional regulator